MCFAGSFAVAGKYYIIVNDCPNSTLAAASTAEQVAAE